MAVSSDFFNDELMDILFAAHQRKDRKVSLNFIDSAGDKALFILSQDAACDLRNALADMDLDA